MKTLLILLQISALLFHYLLNGKLCAIFKAICQREFQFWKKKNFNKIFDCDFCDKNNKSNEAHL